MLKWLVEMVQRAASFVVVPFVFAFGAVVSFMKPAAAAIDLSEFTINLASVETLVPIILIGGAAMWVIRKLIKTTNRS